MKLLFCLVGWMKYYEGLYNGDSIRGGGTYVDENESGSEIHNFTIEKLPADSDFFNEDNAYIDICLGFVMCHSQIRIERLGANTWDNYTDKITVIWLAKDPDHGNVYVVGWYKNARVFRLHQEADIETEHYENSCYYNIMARAEDCTLVPEEKRNHAIRRAKSATSGGIGRSNVWFAEGEKNADIVSGVLKYIDEYDVIFL